MLVEIKMEIEAKGLNSNMGSLFHGYIMENIDPAYAEYFHYNDTNPFTSSIYKDRKTKKFFWRITTYNKKAYDMIVTYFLENNLDKIYIKHKDLEVAIKSFEMKKSSFEDIFLSEEGRNKIELYTVTSFKSDGMTHIFPNIQTLLKGVITKINKHSDTVKLESDEIINEFLQRVYIRDYNLRTQNFYVEKVRIKGFIGDITLGIKGNDPALKQILNFLVLASKYTGLGIKTSLGMGAVEGY